MVLLGSPAPAEVAIVLPGGRTLRVSVSYARLAGVQRDGGAKAQAAVRKDAGDDPDITNGLEIVVTLWPAEGAEMVFLAGLGVGTVTKPGLQIPPGEPAINPAPRAMIAAAIAEVTGRVMCVEVSIPGGLEVAEKTYNPRLGVVGGLSVLGTTGIVRPYCKKALRDSLSCELDVAAACGVRGLVLVPGNIGARAVRGIFALADEQVVEVGNEWGFIASALAKYPFQAVLAAGHPGKLAKLAAGDWDTHSSRSQNAVPFVRDLAGRLLGHKVGQATTTEGLFDALPADDRRRLGDELARLVRVAFWDRIARRMPAAALLVDMAGRELGRDGEFSTWQ
jgi:cobalt-precorrin-5B (C1)-methyltransferase